MISFNSNSFNYRPVHLNNTSADSNTSVKFGWTLENPPEKYHFVLSKSDFDDFDNLIPSEDFVDTLVERMQRDENSLHKPGFVIITNTLPLLGNDPVKVAEFYQNISKQTFEKLFPEEPYYLNEEEMDYYRPDKHYILEHNGVQDKFNGTGSWVQPPHFDIYGSCRSLLGTMYGPGENYTEGGFRISDWHEGEKVLGHRIIQANDHSPANLSQKELTKRFSLEFNHLDFKTDMPIVLMNNHYRSYGVAHDGLKYKPIKSGWVNRPLNRILHVREPEPETKP